MTERRTHRTEQPTAAYRCLPDERPEKVKLPEEIKGRLEPDSQWVQNELGGSHVVRIIQCDGAEIWVDEDSLVKQKRYNLQASWAATRLLDVPISIVGAAVVFTYSERSRKVLDRLCAGGVLTCCGCTRNLSLESSPETRWCEQCGKAASRHKELSRPSPVMRLRDLRPGNLFALDGEMWMRSVTEKNGDRIHCMRIGRFDFGLLYPDTVVEWPDLSPLLDEWNSIPDMERNS